MAKERLTAVIKALRGGDEGYQKHYGTEIQLYIGVPGRPIGNALRVWYMADELGGHLPSEREHPDAIRVHDNHYESTGDFFIAKLLTDLINNAEIEIELLADDEDAAFGSTNV